MPTEEVVDDVVWAIAWKAFLHQRQGIGVTSERIVDRADVLANARRLRGHHLHEDVAHGFAANGARPTPTALPLPPALVLHASLCVQSWRTAKPPCAVRM